MSTLPSYLTDVQPTLPTLATAADAGGGGGALAGLSNLFSSVGTAITNVYRTVNPPQIVQAPGTVGGLIYNPQTGQYVPAVQGTTALSSNTLLLIGVGILAFVLLRR